MSARAQRIACGAKALVVAVLAIVVNAPSRAQTDAANPSCGEPVTVATHANTATRYALARPGTNAAFKPPIALVLLPGRSGHIDLDASGCPRALLGNFLVRSLAYFHALGFITALVDARSDHLGDEGLAGLRAGAQHADDLGKVIADVRARTSAAIWIIGTSRGTISAANAAARLAGASAPDGLVLTSPLSAGAFSRQRPWVSQSVFDFALDTIRVATLIVGHSEDACIRTPPSQMDRIAGRIGASRKQVVTVTGGPGVAAGASDPCAGRTAHGFLEQEAEVIAGIARFIRGERY